MPRLLSEGLRYTLPAAAGALFTTGLAPYDFWPAVPISCGLFLCLLHRWRNKSAFLTGWLYGAGFFLTGASWVYVSIRIYGHAPAVLAGLLTGAFCLGLALLHGGLALLYSRFLKSRRWWSGALGFPALWVLFEWLRSWLLTGFPWLYAGYAALDTPLAGWAPITGVFGLSLWLTALGAAVAVFLESRERRSLSYFLSGLLLIAVTGQALRAIPWTRPTGSIQRVAIYQPNIELEKKWNRQFRASILEQYRATSLPLYTSADVLLWPESALPALREQVSDYLRDADLRAQSGGSTLITGIATRSDRGLHNSIIALGSGKGVHHKQKLVPFGEYVPLEQWLRGLIDFFDLPMSQFVPSQQPYTHLTAGNYDVAPFICYEVVYPDYVTLGARGSNWLITVSNDSWFGDSIGPLQHLQMARFGALATGRDMIRGTNNGVSAIINHRGDITASTPQFSETVLTGDIQPRSGETPVMRTGSWPVLLMSLSIITFSIIKRQSGHQGSNRRV